jgi:hypothetical protein
MTFRKAELQGFDAGAYTADILIAGGHTVFLEDVAVARNLPSGEMVTGRTLVVAFFDDFNPREAVVVAVYTP